MHPHPLCLAVAALLASVATPAWADELASSDVNTLDRLNVSHQRAVPFAGGNMDLVRSENDAQGYVILGRDKIEQSGATNVEDPLRQQLSMSSSFSSSSNNAGGFGGASSKISLRGLPASQTLVLINGRRAAGVAAVATARAATSQISMASLWLQSSASKCCLHPPRPSMAEERWAG